MRSTHRKDREKDEWGADETGEVGRETTRPGSRSGSWGIRSTSASDGGGQRGSRVRKGIEGGRAAARIGSLEGEGRDKVGRGLDLDD